MIMKNYVRLFTIISFMFMSPMILSQKKATVLILIHSDNGGTYELAKDIKNGIESDGSVQAMIKQVKKSEHPKLKDIPVAKVEELPNYDGIVFGSPVYFGNISTAMSEFIAKTTDLWSAHALEGLPASVFMSAGSGAGKELALQAFWNSLAVHGMVLVSNGIRGTENIDKATPQGHSVLGITSLTSLNNVTRPTPSEHQLAMMQGKNFATVVQALSATRKKDKQVVTKVIDRDVNQILKDKNIILPSIPPTAGNYLPYVRTGNLVYINQYAMADKKIVNPGKVLVDVTEEQVKEATRITMLNVLAVLGDAVGGDFNRVKRCVNMVGVFNAPDNYTKHPELMNVASDLTVEIFGEKGRHARSTFGVSSIPGNSSVELLTVFEIE